MLRGISNEKNENEILSEFDLEFRNLVSEERRNSIRRIELNR